MSPQRFKCRICSQEIAAPGVECPYCKAHSAIAEGASPRILITVFGVMVVVFTLTSLYARSFKIVRDERGKMRYDRAMSLLAEGKHLGAMGEFREALVHSRDNPDYRLGLAKALFEAGRYSEAETYLTELRGANPTSGIVSLLLGRMAASNGQIDVAVSHFRTAIRGQWEDGADQRRLALRLELVELLLDTGRRQQLTAELLDLEEELPADRSARLRVASLMLRVGLFSQASSLFRNLLDENPRDRVALLGRGDAEFELGNYLTARTQYNRAQALRRDGRTQARVGLCNRIIELDPTRRGISLAERFRRSRVLVQRGRAAVGACHDPRASGFAGPLPGPLDELARTLDMADLQLERAGGSPSVEKVEANTQLAERVWALAPDTCDDPIGADEPLARVMAKLAR